MCAHLCTLKSTATFCVRTNEEIEHFRNFNYILIQLYIIVTVVCLSDAEPLSVSQVCQVHGHTLARPQLAAGRNLVTPIPCSNGTRVAGQDIVAARSADVEFL